LYLEGYPDLGPASSQEPIPANTPPEATAVRYQFAFQPAPRPLIGEPVLQLTGGMIIDYRAPALSPPFPNNSLTRGNIGYRDWANPSTGGVNPPPYWPTTTSGVTDRLDLTDPTNQSRVIDIVFGPSGQVLNNDNGVVCLWVREWTNDSNRPFHPRLGDGQSALPTQLDRQQEYDTCGEQILIAISTRSGLIATHPIVPPPPTPSINYDPYRNAKDGVNSGL
jgi:hypothetical protein